MIPANVLLEAYRHGVFPMADENGEIAWFEADPRTILDIHSYRIPRDLRRILNHGHFEIRFDYAFEQIIRCCADRDSTWISEEIIASYINLHQLGYAHSVEAWLRPNVATKNNDEASTPEARLAGGLYGVAVGAAFFGESMFHRVSHASKVALVHLAKHLRSRDFELHDAQMMTSTVKLFGAQQISRKEYMIRLQAALQKEREF